MINRKSASKASRSDVQREAEVAIRNALAAELGTVLEPKPIELWKGARVEVDGFAAGPPPTVVEIFAHQGPLKAGQTRKLLADAFKLLAVRKYLGTDTRLFLVVADEHAERALRHGWHGKALDAFEIAVTVHRPPPDLVERIREAQRRQRMTNAAEG